MTDVDAALAFYVGVLGFSLRRRGEGTGGGELAFLVAPGGGELQLRRGSPDLAHAAALNVDDVDALLVRTKAVRGPYTLPSGSRVAFVADPDGNRLELVQKPAAPLPRLTFLGTGDAFGTGGRAQSATLLEDYAGALLVDCGGNALAALLAHGADPSRLDAIVVTHLHGDHFAGLPFVLMHQGVIARRTRPLVIAGPPGTSERLAALREALYAGSTKKPLFPLEHVELAPGEVMVAGRAVRCFPARHMSAPHKAFSLRIGGAAFSGDTALSPALADCARGADVLVVECSSAEPLEDHLSWRELAGVVPLGARRVVVNHVGPGVAERRAELEASGVTLAEDGLVVSLSVT